MMWLSSILPMVGSLDWRRRVRTLSALLPSAPQSNRSATDSIVSPGRLPPPIAARDSVISAQSPALSFQADARTLNSSRDAEIMRQMGIFSVGSPRM